MDILVYKLKIHKVSMPMLCHPLLSSALQKSYGESRNSVANSVLPPTMLFKMPKLKQVDYSSFK